MSKDSNDALAVLASGTGLMAFASTTVEDLPEVGDGGIRFPGFKVLHKLAEDFDTLSQAGMKHGDMVIMNADLVEEGGPRHIRVPDNSSFLLLKSFGPFWSKYNGDGDSDLSWKEPADNRNRSSQDKAKEHMILLGLIITPDGHVYPVRYWGRNWNQVGPFKTLIREVKASASEDWAGQSSAHMKAYTEVAAPTFRVVLPLTVKLENAKAGGTYGELRSPGPRPVSPDEAAAIQLWASNGEAGLAEAQDAFENLVERQKEGLGEAE